MANKPTSKPNWVSDDGAAKIKEPTSSKKLTGWVKNERPPFNFWNWLLNIFSKWLHYFAGNAQYNIIIDSDTDEGDYTSMAAYIADSPAAGDRVLVKVDEVLAATPIIPAGVEITQQKGKKFTLTANFSPIMQFGDNVKIKGDLRIENSNTGTIAKAFSINGDNNHHDNLIIENISTGTITDGVYIEAGKSGNYGQSRSINSGAGAITNDLTDNSGNDENYLIVRGDAAVSKSRGFKHQHSDDGDGGSVLDPVLLKLKKGADIASAAALAPGNDGNYFDVTGAITVTSINTVGVGTVRRFHFDEALTITHHSTNLVLPGGENITTVAGDEFAFVEYAASDWRMISASNFIPNGAQVYSDSVIDGEVAAITSQIPLDDTKPQITEGTQVMSLSYTPKSATNKLKIQVTVFMSDDDGAGLRAAAALFKDADADALRSGLEWSSSTDRVEPVTFTHVMVAGTTSPITFRVRAGYNSGNGTFNGIGSGATRRHGGTLGSSIIITETKAA